MPHKFSEERLPSSGPTLAPYLQAGFSHDSLAGPAALLFVGELYELGSYVFSQSDKHGQVPNPTVPTQALCPECLWSLHCPDTSSPRA